MKFSILAITALASMVNVVSSQQWSLKFWGTADCTPINQPAAQRSGTSNQNCAAIGTANINAYKFNSGGSFTAQLCRAAGCTDCDDALIENDGTTCTDGIQGTPYRSFLITRDENAHTVLASATATVNANFAAQTVVADFLPTANMSVDALSLAMVPGAWLAGLTVAKS